MTGYPDLETSIRFPSVKNRSCSVFKIILREVFGEHLDSCGSSSNNYSNNGLKHNESGEKCDLSFVVEFFSISEEQEEGPDWRIVVEFGQIFGS
jgi:hypothetical protein